MIIFKVTCLLFLLDSPRRWYFLCYLMMTEFWWLCCLYDRVGHYCPLRGDPEVTGRHGADGPAMGGHTLKPHTHTHTDRAPAFTRSSTHIEAGINDSASLKYICMYVYFCVCFLVHHDWIIVPNGRTACWCITGSILFEQGHWMASCQGVMNVIYTCKLNKERKAYWDLDILTSS